MPLQFASEVGVPATQLAAVSTPFVQLDVSEEAQAPVPQFTVAGA